LLLLQSLFDMGYRRITSEVDARDVISRKFHERCGFLLEAILRKHRVVNERNRDTALYVILNHEWDEREVKLKKYLGWELKAKGVNAFAIPDPKDVIPIKQPQMPATASESKSEEKADEKKHA
jgi:hypothetical protein